MLQRVLERAEQQYGLQQEQIDVLLCGGSSEMPMVNRMIGQVMGKPPLYYEPQLLVSMGAAYMACLLGIMPTEAS